MQDDLLDACAAVDWAVSHIPQFKERFIEWQRRSRPYELVMEHDADAGKELLVAYLRQPFDLTFNAEAGAIINSIRSSLDLLAAALARRNRIVPTRKHHFPISQSAADFERRIESQELKEWLSESERAAIKSFRPYQGGDELLWTLHSLDIVRKHDRLLVVKPTIVGAYFTARFAGAEHCVRHFQDKSILLRLPAGTPFRATEGNSNLTCEIFLNEAALGSPDQPATPMLRRLAEKAKSVIGHFGQ